MIKIDTIKVALPLKKMFEVSGGKSDCKTNVLVILNNRYSGEAATSVYYGPSADELVTDLQKGIAQLQSMEQLDVEALDAIGDFPISSVARSALVAMVLNYISGETNRYPWEVLSLGTPVGIKNSFTIGIDSPENMLESIKQSDSPIIKIKMGNDDDVILLEKLSEISGKEFRIDANGGWSLQKAEEMILQLGRLGIRIIEQPTSPEHIKEWPHLKGKNEDIVLIMDEGLNTLHDFEQFAQYVDGVNIKMEKSGGIIEGIKLAEAIRAQGKKIMAGCMIESSVGVAQSVYMSSLADFHDLDAPLHLETDIARGLHFDGDTIKVDREIIGGPKLIRDVVERFIAG